MTKQLQANKLEDLESQPYKYFIAEKKDDEKESLILKTGITSKFSLNDVLADIESLKKRKTEFEAKIDYEQAKIDNVMVRYSEVKDMDEKIRIACSIYQISNEVIKRTKVMLDMVNKQLDEEAKQIDDIAEQVGIKLEEEKPAEETKNEETNG
jgi:hypothetical protein